MNTHELARALSTLARVLRASPKREIDDLEEIFGVRSRKKLSNKEIQVGLSHLVALSRVDRKNWIELVDEYDFPINIRPRDASRDILGKLLRYLEQTPEARARIEKSTYDKGIKASPELTKALASLLKE